MKILVANAGSSSLKYQLIDMDGEKLLAKGTVERIGIDGGKLKQKVPTADGEIVYEEAHFIPDHVEAIQMMLRGLLDAEKGAIKSLDEIDAIGHRVLHGGEVFSGSVLVTPETMAQIEKLVPLGPLHQRPNINGILACQKAMPGKPNVAVFDTAFHQTMPAKAFMYGVPLKYYKELGVRRYGFHGTSHRYVSKRVCEFLGISPVGQKIIVAHLGNGSSLSAVVDGKCVDTSMGLTPLEGVLMGTRSGVLDPAVVSFIAENENMTASEVVNMMNKKSGLLGISGVSSDMRDVDAAADAGNADAALARDMLVYGIKKYIGSYAAAMNGVDLLVFTAGIGENNGALRARVLENMDYLGIKLDPEKNAACADGHATECVISAADSKVKVLVIPTNEEIMIARDTLELVSK